MIEITIESIFNISKVEEVQQQYKNVKVDAMQKGMATAMAKLLSNYIPLNDRTLRGFIFLSFLEWQQKSKAFLADMNKPEIPIERKFEITDEINDILLHKLTRVLINEKDRNVLENGIAEGTKILRDILRKQWGK
ncbi:MAG: hypothetical protein ACFFAO_10735 [Candidatus Hermodarchaeota archaeon]